LIGFGMGELDEAGVRAASRISAHGSSGIKLSYK
jgi:hypothetical protein